MIDHVDAVFAHVNVRRAVVLNYGWAIHVSPHENLGSITNTGLGPYRDAPIPEDLKHLVEERNVLCLHPLGAKECPPPVSGTVKFRANMDMVTFAIDTNELPQKLHIDWSNDWPKQRNTIDLHYRLSGQELVRLLLVEYGSFVTYEAIPPDKLKVFCEGCEPANPKTWPALTGAQNIATFKRR